MISIFINCVCRSANGIVHALTRASHSIPNLVEVFSSLLNCISELDCFQNLMKFTFFYLKKEKNILSLHT